MRTPTDTTLALLNETTFLARRMREDAGAERAAISPSRTGRVN
ncbi:hypothetical protein [Elioraea sp.]|nr:hypothetical protein [Elioraea sp.]